MKSDRSLISLSLVLIVLMAIHLNQDVVYGYDPSGPANLVGVGILAVWLYAAVALTGRRAGYMILIVGSLFAALMPVIHLSGAGVRDAVIQSQGGLLFLATLTALGAGGSVAVLLSLQGLWRREQSLRGFLVWTLITIGLGGAFFGALVLLRG